MIINSYLRRCYIIAIAMFLPIIISGCDDKKKEEIQAPPLVRTIKVAASESSTERFTGIIVAQTQSNLSFRVAGKIIKKYVDIGQEVRKGQLLAEVDGADFTSRLNASQQALYSAKAELVKASNNEKRYASLIGSGAVSQVDYDETKAQADVARANLRSAQEHLNIANNEQKYTQLIANSDGIITNTYIETGEYVSAGQIVVQLAHFGPREAKVNLPEDQRPQIGSTALAYLYGSNKSTAAKLRLLSGAADHITRTYNAYYTLENVSPPLGSTVSIHFDTQTTSKMAKIPITALNDFGQGAGVWCIDEVKSLVFWCPVAILKLDNESAYVSGINTNSLIVSLGAHLLHENERVRYHPLKEENNENI